ncbi:MAG: SDR family oxidoreductase [Terricaulis sp.]
MRGRSDLDGRLVFITGGAGGIGYGMARAFAREGARIVIADVREDLLHSATEQLKEDGAEAISVELDVRDAGRWESALDEAEARFGPLAVMCSNAGVAGSRLPLEDTDLRALEWTFDVNVSGAFLAIQHAVPRLRRHGGSGHVVLTASMGAFLVRGGNGVYSASKAAIVAFAEALRFEFASSPLGVSVLCPGLVSTDLISGNAERAPSGVSLGEHEPELEEAMRQALDPFEVGQAVVRGIYEGRFWLFTHPGLRTPLEERFNEILG